MLPVEEIDIEPHSIIEADVLDLPYEDESFHAIVTDPPYGLAFMGRTWDQFEPKEYQEFCESWAKECFRVLKPGGHMLAFSGTRTYDRMATGVEDAGFEIRDKIDYLYGSGFPKALDVSKAIDKRADAERKVVGKKIAPDGKPLDERVSHSGEEYDESSVDYDDCKRDTFIREPATDAAKKWDGWKTGLKPAHEPIVVARKPIEEDTIAEQVMETGTGALNIDETRIGYADDEPDDRVETDYTNPSAWSTENSHEGWKREAHDEYESNKLYKDEGRYPANIILDIEAAQMLDEEVGELSTGDITPHENAHKDKDTAFQASDKITSEHKGDTGGPSRYFYTSKASKSERTMNDRIENSHPTVKPIDLMQYLVRLVTAEGQKVCDPFLGSGTTLLACEEEKRVGYGSDMDKEYCDIATKRLGIRMGTELGSFMDY